MATANTLVRFEVYLEKFDKPFSDFEKPKKIGSFSKNVAEDEISLLRPFKAYFYDGNLGSNLSLDLGAGYDSFISREGKEKTLIFTLYLQWFKQYFNNVEKYRREKPEFFCGRGVLRKFLTTPYERNESWFFAAERFNGTIFIREIQRESSEISDNLMYGGYKFEQYMTTATIGGVPATDVPVDTTTAFYAVVKAQLGRHSIICGGEVDCYESDNEERYVELKSLLEINNNQKKIDVFKRFKLLKCWAQSVPLGISTIVCGFRDDEGIVHRTEEFKTSDIPRIARSASRKWEANICFNCCNDLLEFIKETANVENRVYKFSWTPSFYNTSYVKCEVVTDVEVLPQDFKDGFKNYC